MGSDKLWAQHVNILRDLGASGVASVQSHRVNVILERGAKVLFCGGEIKGVQQRTICELRFLAKVLVSQGSTWEAHQAEKPKKGALQPVNRSSAYGTVQHGLSFELLSQRV